MQKVLQLVSDKAMPTGMQSPDSWSYVLSGLWLQHKRLAAMHHNEASYEHHTELSTETPVTHRVSNTIRRSRSFLFFFFFLFCFGPPLGQMEVPRLGGASEV